MYPYQCRARIYEVFLDAKAVGKAQTSFSDGSHTNNALHSSVQRHKPQQIENVSQSSNEE